MISNSLWIFAHSCLDVISWLLGEVVRVLDYIVRHGTEIGTLLLACSAMMGLRGWFSKTKASNQIGIIDDLIVTVHQYSYEMNMILEKFKIIKILMNKCVYAAELSPSEKDKALILGLKSYIKMHGKRDGLELRLALKNIIPVAAKIGFLSNKAKVYQFRDHKKFFEACVGLTSVVNVLNSVATVFVTDDAMLDDPYITHSLSKIYALTDDELKLGLDHNFSEIMQLSQKAYGRALLLINK